MVEHDHANPTTSTTTTTNNNNSTNTTTNTASAIKVIPFHRAYVLVYNNKAIKHY